MLVDIAGKIPQDVKDNLWSAIKSGSFDHMAVRLSLPSVPMAETFGLLKLSKGSSRPDV